MTNLTNLELQVLECIDQSEYGDTLTDAIWFWASDMGADIGITAKAVGGVVTSLQEKGYVKAYIASARDRRNGDESTLAMTAAGAAAYVAAKGGKTHKPTNEQIDEIGWDGWRALRDAREAAAAAPASNTQADFVAAILGE